VATPKEHLLKAIELDPGFADAHYQLALLLVNEGNALASEHFCKVLDIDADHVAARFQLAILQVGIGHVDEARDHFETLLVNDPRDAQAHYQLGLLALGQGNSHDAIYHFEKTSSLDPDNADAHYRLGLLHDTPEEFDKTRFLFQTAIDYDPSHTEAHFNLGLHLRRARRYDNSGNLMDGGMDSEARSFFETTLRLDHSHAAAHEELGSLLAKTGEDQLAIQSFTAAIRHDPNRINAYLGLAALYESKDAIRTCAKALEQDPQHPAVHLRKAQFHMAKQDTTAAKDHYLQAADHAVEQIQNLKDEALKAIAENRFIPARKKEDLATEFSSHRAEALFQLGLLINTNLVQARQHFESALAADSLHSGAHHHIAIIHHEEGDDESAIESLRRSVEIEIENPEAHFLLAELLQVKGDDKMARNHYLITLDLDPGHSEAKRNLSSLA
jgi:tetratricopeptide (TPR) repeat protein